MFIMRSENLEQFANINLRTLDMTELDPKREAKDDAYCQHLRSLVDVHEHYNNIGISMKPNYTPRKIITGNLLTILNKCC